MKRVLVVLMVCLFFASCGEEIEPLQPLPKGIPNTITLSTGKVVYNLDGEWDAFYDGGATGTSRGIVKIAQDGNQFVGFNLIENESAGKGNETIKGELEKNGFKSLSANTMHGWKPASGKIGEKCNEIVIKASIDMAWENLIITLTRK
jgi:hypothetical protein